MPRAWKEPYALFLRPPCDRRQIGVAGPNLPDQFRRVAEIVDKILRGTKPVDIPVEQPTKFNLIINLTTAKVLGLKIPESVLSRADEVIE